jgi:tRNA threonylcarbamoyl adenosine modification protein (Sua5/YciO/YrdC/YwlC family)
MQRPSRRRRRGEDAAPAESVAGAPQPEQFPAEVVKVSANDPESKAIEYAAELITSGHVVGVPTDTFYGLAADPFNLAAVEEIYRVKGRPENRALPILVKSVEQAIALTRDLPPIFVVLAQKLWPGALTLVVDASHRLPRKVTADTGRVALRWPASAVACALIEQVGRPITGTSANLSGHRSCSNAGQLMKQLGYRIPLILDAGETGGTISSTILDLRDDEWSIVREGQITEQQIRQALEED